MISILLRVTLNLFLSFKIHWTWELFLCMYFFSFPWVQMNLIEKPRFSSCSYNFGHHWSWCSLHPFLLQETKSLIRLQELQDIQTHLSLKWSWEKKCCTVSCFDGFHVRAQMVLNWLLFLLHPWPAAVECSLSNRMDRFDLFQISQNPYKSNPDWPVCLKIRA